MMRTNNFRSGLLAATIILVTLFSFGISYSQTANYEMNNAGALSEKLNKPAPDEKIAAFFDCAFVNPRGTATNEGYLKTDIMILKDESGRNYNGDAFLTVKFEDRVLNGTSWPKQLEQVQITRSYGEITGIKTENFSGREYAVFTICTRLSSFPEKTGIDCEVYTFVEGNKKTAASKTFSFADVKLKSEGGTEKFSRLRRDYYGKAASFMTEAFVSGDMGAWNYFLNKYVYFISRSFAVKFDSPKYVDSFINRFRSLRRGSEFTYSFALVSGSVAMMESLQLEGMKNISKSLDFFRDICYGKEEPLFIEDKIFVHDSVFNTYVDSRFFGAEDIKKYDIYEEKEIGNFGRPEHKKYLKKIWTPDKGMPGHKISGKRPDGSIGEIDTLKKYPHVVIVEDSTEGRPAYFYTLGYYPQESAKDLENFKNKYAPALKVKPNYVRIDKLTAPQIKSHDYDKMITELGRKSGEIEIFKTAYYCPKDCSYFYFGTVSGALDIFDEAKKYSKNLSTILPTSDNFSGIKEKLEKQLLIKVNPMLRPFYGLAVSDMTIILDDLYVNEGAAMGVFFNVLQKMPFDAARAKNKKEIIATSPGSKISEGAETYSGNQISFTVSEDGKIRSYETVIGSHYVVTNSLSFMKRVIDTASSKDRALGNEIDFIYMRALYKEKNPAGFLYFGDSAVRKMTGPAFKINEKRRVNCMDNLDELNSSLDLYRCLYEKGTGEIEIPKLLKYGCLINEFVCPSGGNYEFDGASGRFFCGLHGHAGFMKPLSELELKFVSETEAKEYNQFVDRYHSYFRNFFDPIGIEIINDRDIISLRTYILPLIDNSEYNFLREIAGGTPTKSEILKNIPGGTFFAVNYTLNMFRDYKPDFSNIKENDLRKKAILGKMSAEADLKWNSPVDIFSWIGPELAVLVQDFGTEELDIRSMSHLEPPIAIINNIKDKNTCLLFLFKTINRHLGLYSDFDRYESQGNRENKKSRNPFKKIGKIVNKAFSSMREVEYLIEHSSQYKDYTIIEVPWFFRLNIGVSEKFAIVAPSRRVVEATIDNIEAGETKEAGITKKLEPTMKSHPETRNVFILFCPENVNKCMNFIVENHSQEIRRTCLTHLKDVNRLKFLRDRASALPEESLPPAGTATCPAGTPYSSDDAGFYFCPLHDNRFATDTDYYYWYHKASTQELEAAANSLKFLFGLAKAVSASLSFTPEGIFTTFTIQKK